MNGTAPGTAFIFIFKPKRSDLERQPWDGLPALMMADQKGKKMRKYRIVAANKEHFESLIKDYRAAGFILVTCGNRFAELETEYEFISIEY